MGKSEQRSKGIDGICMCVVIVVVLGSIGSTNIGRYIINNVICWTFRYRNNSYKI